MNTYDHPATVCEKRIITDSLFTITFSSEKKIPFKAGQYLSVVLAGKRPVPLSIASSEHASTIEFGILTKGENTQAIRALSIGDHALLRGPFGKFTLNEHDLQHGVCCIAAGTGITPFMSMLRTANAASHTRYADVVLFCSFKRKEDVLWGELLTNKKVHVTFTQEEVVGYHHGRIDVAFIKDNVPDYSSRSFLLCGGKEFVQAMTAALIALGVSQHHIRFEAW